MILMAKVHWNQMLFVCKVLHTTDPNQPTLPLPFISTRQLAQGRLVPSHTWCHTMRECSVHRSVTKLLLLSSHLHHTTKSISTTPRYIRRYKTVWGIMHWRVPFWPLAFVAQFSTPQHQAIRTYICCKVFSGKFLLEKLAHSEIGCRCISKWPLSTRKPFHWSICRLHWCPNHSHLPTISYYIYIFYL